MSIYNLRAISPTAFQMAKFDADLNVEAVYNLTVKGTGYTCDCPASARVIKYKPCKHQRMMPLMMGAVNTQRMYDPETKRWGEPVMVPQEEPTPVLGVAVEITEEVHTNGSSLEPPVASATSAPAQAAEVIQPQPPRPTPSGPIINRRI